MKSFNSVAPSNPSTTRLCNGVEDKLMNKTCSFLSCSNSSEIIKNLVNKNSTNNNNDFYMNKRKYVAQWQPKQILNQNNHIYSNNNNNQQDNDDNFIKRKKIKQSRTSSPLSTSSNSSSMSSQSSLFYNQYSPVNDSSNHTTHQPLINIKTSSHYNVVFIKNNQNNITDTTNNKFTKSDNDHFKLRSNYLTQFFSNFKEYIIDKTPFDICLLLNDNQKINAHKIMLINGSNYFRDRITNLVDETTKCLEAGECSLPTVLEMKQINSYECLELCIKFIYTGGSQLNLINLDLIDELKITAKLLELNDLVGLCDLINANIETKNIILNSSKKLINENNKNFNGCSKSSSSFQQYESINNNNCLRNSDLNLNNNFLFDNKINPKLFYSLLNSVNNGCNNWQLGTDFISSSINNLLKQIANSNNNNNYNNNNNKQYININDNSIKTSHNYSIDQINNCNNKSIIEENNHIDSGDVSVSKLANQENKLKIMLNNKLEKYQRINNEGHALFDLLDVSKNVRDYFCELFSTSLNLEKNSLELDMEIETLNRELVIKDKYIYPVMFSKILCDIKKTDLEKQLLINNQLNECFENYTYVNLFNTCSNLLLNLTNNAGDFYKPSLIIFSLSIGQNNHFKFNNYLIQEKLNFTDLNVLKDDIKKCLDTFLNDYLLKKLNLKNGSNNLTTIFQTNINSVYYLKKPSNCKTIKLEEIKSSTDCFRALVEYSRVNSINERPYVLVTIKANVILSINKK
jgi:hypothetical protein